MEILRNQISHSTLLFFAILCLLPTSIFSANEGYMDYEGEFNYDPCSKKGPGHWGDLKKEWEMCKNGKRQSSIALISQDSIFYRLGVLKRKYTPNSAVLINNAHEVAVVWEGNAGSIKIKGFNYYLQNFHWHHPSEHTLDGKRYPLELHMVHITNERHAYNKIAVIAVFFEFGPPDPFLSKLENDIKCLNIGGGEKWVGIIDPREVSFDGKRYYRYMGSLTTPPCSEGVIWTVDFQSRFPFFRLAFQSIEGVSHFPLSVSFLALQSIGG